jgi:Zn-dependent protease
MKCKKCGKSMPLFFSICPVCGKDNEEKNLDLSKMKAKKLSLKNIDDHIVVTEVEKCFNRKENAFANILVAAVSLVLFISLGSLGGAVERVLVILGILIFHEFGHIAGMKLFGHKNIRMLFIPFLGAMVSSNNFKQNGYQDGIITILGPLPGIILSLVLLFTIGISSTFSHNIILSLIFINGFNLLPIFPLDGGRFLDIALLNRNIIVQIISRILAGLLLILFAIYLQNIYLGLFAVVSFILIAFHYRIYILSESVKKKIKLGSKANINEKNIIVIHNSVKERYPDIIKPKQIAKYICEVWEKINQKSISTSSSVALILVYLFSVALLCFTLYIYSAQRTGISV